MEKLRQELCAEKIRVEELEEAKIGWEVEANRLRVSYETLEGFINTAMEEWVLTSFLEDGRCGKLFAHLSMLVVGEVLANVEDCFQKFASSFRLPKKYQILVDSLKGNVYLWEDGAFNFQELIAPIGEASV